MRCGAFTGLENIPLIWKNKLQDPRIADTAMITKVMMRSVNANRNLPWNFASR